MALARQSGSGQNRIVLKTAVISFGQSRFDTLRRQPRLQGFFPVPGWPTAAGVGTHAAAIHRRLFRFPGRPFTILNA